MKHERTEVTRGDIYFYDYGENEGSIQSGRRPVVVLQSAEVNEHAPTVIVAALTSAIKKKYLPSHIYLGERFGLKKASMILVEQIRTINKSELEEYVGHINDNDQVWKVINNAIKKTLGLWVYKREDPSAIRTLCPRCLRDYLANPAYRIKRKDIFDSLRQPCDKCDGLGHEYVVYEFGHGQGK
jgi:mRNA interferase MazF